MSTRATRARFLALTLASAVGLAASLYGDTASAELPSYQSIPTGKLPAAADMTNPPQAIAATEHVDGLFVAKPPEGKRDASYKQIYVFASEQEAKDYGAQGRFDTKPDGGPPRACLATNGSTSTASRASIYVYNTRPTPPPPKPAAKPLPKKKPAGMSARDWQIQQALSAASDTATIGMISGGSGVGLGSIGSASSGNLAIRSTTARPKTIYFVRSERFVESDGGKPCLELTDAWVDVDSLGARMVGKSSVALGRVGTGPGGVEIYAARDDKNVQFVVRPPRPLLDKDVPAHVAMLGTRMNAQTPTGSASTGDCGHMRVNVAVEPGTGQMVTVFGSAILPPAPDDDDAPDTAKSDDDDDGRAKAKAPHDVRIRPFVASLSVSQTKSEKEPIVSVAFGWAGKDQHQRF